MHAHYPITCLCICACVACIERSRKVRPLGPAAFADSSIKDITKSTLDERERERGTRWHYTHTGRAPPGLKRPLLPRAPYSLMFARAGGRRGREIRRLTSARAKRTGRCEDDVLVAFSPIARARVSANL